MLYRGHSFDKPAVSYDVQDVLDLQHMLKQHGGHTLQCVTDGTFDLPPDIETVIMPEDVRNMPNYLPKLWLWSAEFHAQQTGRQIVYLDLDCIILKDPAKIVSDGDDLRIWDWAKDEMYNTSFFVLRAGHHPEVWDRRSQIAHARSTMTGPPGAQSRWTGDQSFVGYVLGPKMPTFTMADGVQPFRASIHAPVTLSRQRVQRLQRNEKHRRVCAGHGEIPLAPIGPTTAPDATLLFFCGPAKPRHFIDRVFWIKAALDTRPGAEKTDRERLHHLGKQCSQHKVLTAAVKLNGWTCGAEIGVLKGKTFFALLDACPDLTMFGVDQWKCLPFREDENAETYQAFDMEGFYEHVLERSRSYGDRAHILRGDSVAMADTIEDGSLDFVFIDGDHTEAGCRRDILAWAPKVKPTGGVFGHDYSWPTVKRVLDELVPAWAGHSDEVWFSPKRKIKW
jgi:hypothetical protein